MVLDHYPKSSRSFLPTDFKLESFADVEPYMTDLTTRPLNTQEDLLQWLRDRDELGAVLSEEMAWSYINYTRQTNDEAAKARYQLLISDISPKVKPIENDLNIKLAETPLRSHLDSKAFGIYLRGVDNALQLYREQNIPLQTKCDELNQEYSTLQASVSIEYRGEELTPQQAAQFLKNPDREVRKEVYEKLVQRREADRNQLDDIFDQLLKMRHEMAQNAGFENYRDYKFQSLGRFDYTVEDVLAFQDSIAQAVVPLSNHILAKKQEELHLPVLQPFDLDAEPVGKEPLQPYSSSQELIDKSIEVFRLLHPKLGEYLEVMKEKQLFDLDSRKGKAPGGYNYPLDETGLPFIFMNASGKMRDLVTMMHEGGHAIHSFQVRNLPFNYFRHTPSEVAELASMSMELISMDGWHLFFQNEKDLNRAKQEHIESILSSLPWIANIDAFQNWVYLHPELNREERAVEWTKIYNRFHTYPVDWTDYESSLETMWHRQLHVFEVPFYYIEYGMAQLGAIAVWRNYKQNPEKALDDYMNALSLGYSAPINEIYAAAGVEFNFSKPYIEELMRFLANELQLIENSAQHVEG